MLRCSDGTKSVKLPDKDKTVLVTLLAFKTYQHTHTHTHTHTTVIRPSWILSGMSWVTRHQKDNIRQVKPIWIYWHKRQWVAVASAGPYANLHLDPDTQPASHHSVFYRPDALSAAQPTASKHWRPIIKHTENTDLITYTFLWHLLLLLHAGLVLSMSGNNGLDTPIPSVQESCAIAKMTMLCADKSKQTATPPPKIMRLSVVSIQLDVMDVAVEWTFSPQNFSMFPWE